MSVDYTKIQLSSNASSNKVLKEGSGTFTIPVLPGAGENFGSATVDHNYGSDNLLYQVSALSNTVGGVIDPTVLPWQSNDARVILYARIDTVSLYIFGMHNDSSGFGDPARDVQYFYRILIP